jgi:D-sedoheptulose 7-phosphate isomerase
MCNFQSFEKEYPTLIGLLPQMRAAFDLLRGAFAAGGKLLLCGNGGSAADCDHIAGELLKGFRSLRPVTDETLPADLREKPQGSLPAISLHSACAAMTATLNDLDPDIVYAQMLHGLGEKGDLLIALSTSGNANNVCNAARLAKAKGLTVLSMTGAKGGKLKDLADFCICVPETETYKVQELHLPVYHYLCAQTEQELF